MQHPDEGTIHAWLDGALDALQRQRVEQHLASCVECEALVAEARGFIAGSSRILAALDDVPGDVVPRRSAVPPTHAALADAARPATIVTPLASLRPRSWVTANAFRIAAAITIVAAGALAGRYGLYSKSQSSTATREATFDAPATLDAVATTGTAATTADSSPPPAVVPRQAGEQSRSIASARSAPRPASPASRTAQPEAAGRTSAGRGAGAVRDDGRLATTGNFAARAPADSAAGRTLGVIAAAPPPASSAAANAGAEDVSAAQQRVAESRAGERPTLGAAPAVAPRRPSATSDAAPSRARREDPARMRAIAGCWRFSAPSLVAERGGGSSPVLLSPLRLDTTLVADGLGAGAYDVRTLPTTRPDFVPYRYMHWRPLGDDRVEIVLSSGFGGMRIELTGRGERMRGTAQTFTDVRGIGERTFAVAAVRVGCE